MMHPDQHYEIAQRRHQEFVVQAQRDHLAAHCYESQNGTPVRRILGLGALLCRVGVWARRAVHRPFGITQVSAHKQ
jgi:hypothetical protein